jgi:alpha-amylase/alpha-mannosidase (GH57 family)
MAALVAAHPGVHLTINLTPSLLWQIEDYVHGGATDRPLDLTLTPAERLTVEERESILGGFFDADWHHQIFPHARYKELFLRRRDGGTFSGQDVRDLQMWFNLAWFGQEFRDGPITLVTGDVVAVHRFIEQARGFSVADVEAMVAEQYKILRAIIPMHRDLQGRGQIEVSTTPLYHPILPLLVNTDAATIDRQGATYPYRFQYPEDADAHVRLAEASYERQFGQAPRGMWPAEGAVSQSVIPIFARHGIQWIATDGGVLGRSGRWGYQVDDADVLCQAYRAEEEGHAIAVFFRDARLSDDIGFHYNTVSDPQEAAATFLRQIRERFARRLTGTDDRVLTIALDGENAWGAYRDDARPFLHALYGLLEGDQEIETVTFSQYLNGDPDRSLAAHPIHQQPRVHDLFTGSWIDENGSAPGVDLGTWIGEAEENRAWDLLGRARDAVSHARVTPSATPAAFDALYIAEGSDWFWWFGDDQDSGRDQEFDDLFRMHIRNIYRSLHQPVPADVDEHIVPHAWLWTFMEPIDCVQYRDRLAIETNCPGQLSWRVDDSAWSVATMAPAGGVMAGVRRHHLTLGPFPPTARTLHFRFRCMHPGCDGRGACCMAKDRVVQIQGPPKER